MIVPGFIDIHTHGCAGFDTCDGTREAIFGMASFLAQQGVTSFCPTTMTVSEENIEAALDNIRKCCGEQPEGAAIRGINMEGPYISVNRKGSQKQEYVRAPDWKQFRRF